jgi:hypothetical protein
MKVGLLAILVGSAFLVLGCAEDQGSGNAHQEAPTKASVDAEIAKIDADPNMPPQAKAMRKAMLQQGGTGQKSMPGKN